MYTYSYLSATSTNLTLKFIFQTDSKHDLYFDDISVKNSSLVEMITNSDFETSTSPIGWTTGASNSCNNFGIASVYWHSYSRAYWYQCNGLSGWIYQSFAGIGGQVYNVTFWLYLRRTASGGGINQVDVYLS